MPVNPFNLGAQEGTYDYDLGPELYRDNGESEAIKVYDKCYQENKKASNTSRRYNR